jgi:hypothetical protein
MAITLSLGAVLRPFAPRSTPFKLRSVLQSKLNELLELKVIRASRAPYASPILLVKQGTDYRCCIDYRAVNEVTERLLYPLPNPRVIFQMIMGSKYFAKLDLAKGYHQMEMSPESRLLTSFVCDLGQFEFDRIPFGLRNAPSFFQHAMATVLTGLLGACCFVFIDDIIVYADGEERFLHLFTTCSNSTPTHSITHPFSSPLQPVHQRIRHSHHRSQTGS